MAKITNLFSNFSSSIVKALVPSFSGMLRVKAGRPIVKWFIKAILLLKGSIKTSDIKVVVSYARKLYTLVKASGIVFTVKYLKACTSLLMQAISGNAHVSTQELGVAASRTGRGLPRLIPALHRDKIRSGDESVIRLWLTLFSVYRVLDYTGKLKISTIVRPSKAIINHSEVIAATQSFIKEFELPLIPWGMEGGFLENIKPFFISTTSPNSTRLETVRDGPKTASSSIYSLLGSFFALGVDETTRNNLREFFYAANSPASDLLHFIGYSKFASGTSRLPQKMSTEVWGGVSETGSSLYMPLEYHYLGKLGYKVEPAGKIRVFAMVDAITQWIMEPLHKEIFSILARLASDATRDQNGTIERFIDYLQRRDIKKVYSFDLSAATDRLPVSVQATILNTFTKEPIGDFWAASLVSRWYQLPPTNWGDYDQREINSLGLTESDLSSGFVKTTKDKNNRTIVTAVKYAVGQPMGALSSWAMLALTHHIMVHIAALRVGINDFSSYLVLGDDLVIANKQVARSYLKVAKEWDIDINMSKSIISTNGSLEFAKRFIYKYKDVSGLSFKEMAVASHDLRGLTQLFNRISKFRTTRVSELLAFLGFGYKSLSRITTKYRKLGERMAKALYLLSYPGERFSSLSSIQGWLMSPSFNKNGLVSFPEEGLSYVKDLILSQADSFKTFNLPKSQEEFRDYFGKLFYDGSISPYSLFPEEDRDKAENLLQNTELFSHVFWEAIGPLYIDSMMDMEDTLIELKDTYEYAEDEFYDIDTLWEHLDVLEKIAEGASSPSNYTTLKDVITLNKSSVLKRAYKIRSYVRSLSPNIRI